MEFTFDKNLKKEILEEALVKHNIDAYRALAMSKYEIDEFDISSFVPDPEVESDLEILNIFGKIDSILLKLESLKD
jgi:hypothetical protein